MGWLETRHMCDLVKKKSSRLKFAIKQQKVIDFVYLWINLSIVDIQ